MAGRADEESVDGLILYRRSGDSTVHRAVASGYTYSDLHHRGMLDDRAFDRLEEVAWVVGREGRLCETEELLDAWLDAFELLASVHAEDMTAHEDPT